jgi:hypothetical protein
MKGVDKFLIYSFYLILKLNFNTLPS